MTTFTFAFTSCYRLFTSGGLVLGGARS